MSAALAAVAGPAGVARAAEANTPEKWVKGVCRYCGTGCGVLVGVKNGKAVAIKGDPNNHNQGFLCLKGALLIPVLNSPDRVTKPMIRRTKGGRLEPISWDEALDHMAKKFRTTIDTYGPDAVAWYGSGQCLTEESYLANKIFKAGFKTNNVDGNPRLCMASAVGGYTTTFGKDEPMGTYADIDRASTFFIIGSNTSEAHPVLFRRIARRKQNEPGVKIIVADPRRTNTSRIADLHIAFRPGTDLALMNGMAWVILHEELDNPRFYNKYAIFKTNDGKDATFDDYRAFLEDYTPDKVAKLCNIPEQQVWEAGRLFAESPATMSLWCMGINQRIRGVWANNLIHNLHLITGQICRPGATSFSLTGQPNACGGVRDTGSLSHLLPAGRVVANKAHRNQMEAFWGIPQDSMSPNVGYHTIALFEALGKADVKAIIICETNPAHTLPNLNKVHKAMSNPDTFITVIEAFPDAVTLEYADLILPPAFWCERDGTYGCGERRYSLIEKAVEPPADCRPTVNTLIEFAKRAGVDPKLVNFRNSADVWDEWRRLSMKGPYNFGGMTREARVRPYLALPHGDAPRHEPALCTRRRSQHSGGSPRQDLVLRQPERKGEHLDAPLQGRRRGAGSGISVLLDLHARHRPLAHGDHDRQGPGTAQGQPRRVCGSEYRGRLTAEHQERRSGRRGNAARCAYPAGACQRHLQAGAHCRAFLRQEEARQQAVPRRHRPRVPRAGVQDLRRTDQKGVTCAFRRSVMPCPSGYNRSGGYGPPPSGGEEVAGPVCRHCSPFLQRQSRFLSVRLEGKRCPHHCAERGTAPLIRLIGT